jgi:hypothetical protein
VDLREATLAAITVAAPSPSTTRSRVATHAIALRAALPEVRATLTRAETMLLVEWLERLAVVVDDERHAQ